MSELAKALAEFQAAQTGLELDKKGNRSQYASVGSMMTTSGEEKVGRYPIAVDDMTNNQKLGSAISYARRYALMAALGMAAGIQEVEFDDDDDGEINGALKDAPKKTVKTDKPYDLDGLEAQIQAKRTLTGLNAWISELNPVLTLMHKENPSDYNRFYAFWQKQEKDLKNGTA